MIIRPFARADLRGLLVVQSEAGAGNTWSEGDYLRLSQEAAGLILIAWEPGPAPGQVAGFAALRRVFDHAELLNLAVRPDRRRRGIGKSLLAEACRRAHADGARTVSLEVRPSNSAAIRLYQSSGFTLQSVRKDYYTDPAEDAQVFIKAMSSEAAPQTD